MRVMRYKLGLAAVLAILWLANSGVYIPLINALGVASVALVVWLAQRLNLLDQEAAPFYLLRRLPAYYAWLFWQIVLSNLDVVRRVWTGDISPRVADVDLAKMSDVSRVIYANSITLTPGTVVLDLDSSHIRVHSISSEVMDGLLSGEMGRRVDRLEN
jgi:multicomponent Na+:H+ antiporter subunit E